MAFTVGELSRLTGVTVRALHHYDEIGLVRPSQRTAAGYRLYDAEEVRRLQQGLGLRGVGATLGPGDAALHALEKGTSQMTTEDFKQLFDGFNPEDYEEEARERWGSTE